ncbi:CPBP family intramembrane glutamic endopeptidase [Mucilaginibacter sp. UYCu711]|uniref:CPBP family intramembrane glutamic endopeptidase n=1 Tax=Mucilaginibacter sp. UYCu711 TaxID=3156339 RepID=UPI003D1978FD
MVNTVQKYANNKMAPLVKSILFIALFILLLIGSGLIRSYFPPAYNMLVYGLLGTGAGYLSVWTAMRIERQTFSSIGMVWEKQTISRFLLGILIGLLIFVLIMVVLLSFSPLMLTYKPLFFTLSTSFIYLPILPLALMEEIGFRSYPQIKLNNAYGVWTSQFVIAVFFGAYHVLNGWSVYASFTGPFVWAFVFGLAALKYGGIAVPTGIHFALNVLQNAFGFKGDNRGIFKLDYLPGTTKAMMNRAEHIGLLLQIIVFIVALTGTTLYIKQQKSKPSPSK